MADLVFSSKYPFSQKAKEALESSNAQLSQHIISLALERIKNSLAGNAEKSMTVHQSDLVVQISSYAASRMILACLKNSFITNKFSVIEAKKAYSYLNSETEENLKILFGEFNFIIKKISADEYLIYFSTYLKYHPGSIDYRLINRNLSNGYVTTNRHELLRLLQEAIREKISRLPLLKKPSQEIKDASSSLVIELPKITTEKLSYKKGENPPCIEFLLIDLKKHTNLNHQARWILAVYLLKKNTPVETILELFSNFPDFKEKISRYQIEHAKKQGYMVPSCATIRGYGLCVSNCPIKNPLQWKKELYEKYGKKDKEG